jgi:hypothetical protein
MTLQLNNMINVEPRHGVAQNMSNIFINKLLQFNSLKPKQLPA